MARATAKILRTELKGHPLKAIGDLNNLNQKLLGIMCSQRCPGDLVLKGFDAAKQIRDQGIIVVSGFHSSMEKDIFEILLRGSQPIIHCLAKSIETYRIPKNLRPRVESGELTIIAPDYPASEKRITKSTSERCNALILDISDQVLIVHAQPGGNLESAFSKYLPGQKNIYTLPSERNEQLLKHGVVTWEFK
jgi:hypothetical protein